MIAELLYLTLGIGLGYSFGEKSRRARILAKLNEWTKPKKEEPKA